jgi:prephenate dehydrogenase
MINTVGIVGYGKLGRFLHEFGKEYFPELEIRIHSRRHEADGETFFDLKTAAQSDLIFLCARIDEYEERMKEVFAYASPDSIFVDVAAVKMYTSDLCKKYCEGRRYLSTHPLFGPDSYEKYKNNIKGFQIVVTDYVLKNDAYQMIKAQFSAFGFSVVEMSAEEHDKQLAETVFITHYIGESIAKARFSENKIRPLSFQYLLDAVENVTGDRRLIKNIYAYNPFCKSVLERFKEAQKSVEKEII